MIKILSCLLGLFLIGNAWADGSCSGFFVSSNGYIGTAAHCQGNKITATYFKNGLRIVQRAIIVCIDKENDLMLLKVNDTGLPFFTFARTEHLHEKVIILGWPMPDVNGYNLKTTLGCIMNLGRQLSVFGWMGYGSSGGAVVNQDGELVGVTDEGYFMLGETMTSNDVVTNSYYLAVDMESKGIPLLADFTTNNSTKMVYLDIEGE